MKFPRRRRAPAPHEHHEPSEATVARIKAEVALENTKARTPGYAALGRSLRELRERNHLAQSFEAAFQNRRTT